MTAEPIQPEMPESLRFLRSDSEAVGAEGTMMDTLRDNAPRIVGTLKLIGDAFILTSSFTPGNPIGLLFYGLFAMPGRLLMMAYGTKEHKEKIAREAAERGETPHEASAWEKITHPSRYPIESSAGLSIVAESSALVAAGQEYLKQPGWEAAGNGVLEMIAVWMYANILFGKEKKEEVRENSLNPAAHDTLRFVSSESKPVGIIGSLRQKMKDNPVMTSCLVGCGISIALAVTGTPIYGTMYLIGAGFLLAANLLQGLLVRKNDFNIEGSQNGKHDALKKPGIVVPPASFQERLAQRDAQPAQLGA